MCGILGVVATTPVNQLLYDGLMVLQHRGQDAAGIVTGDGGAFHMHKAPGLVRDVFRTRNMRALPGNMGIAHCRYPTAGSPSDSSESQPFYVNSPFGLVLARRLVAEGREVIACTLHGANLGAVPGARVLHADRLQAAPAGLRFNLVWAGHQADVNVRMVAPFNVSNLIAVAGALLARGVDFSSLAPVLSRLVPPQGRMQLVGGVCEPLVVVDYAHSPDALAKVLEALRATVHTRGGRLVCVFGCGGDRDPGKRPMMGEIARSLADRVVVTSDNPRSEDPLRIIEAIAAGAGPQAEQVVDRAQAIARAIGEAGPDDVVLIAGKGHEPYQEILGQRLPFSDLEQARLALRGWQTRGKTQ